MNIDVDVAELRLREATKRFKQAQASGDAGRMEEAKREMEKAFNDVATQRN